PVHDARLETCRARARERVAAERVAFLEGLRNAPDGFPTAAADPVNRPKTRAPADRREYGVRP
ncbi:hypothetical protein LZF96_22015, partial [Streptomyces sp. ST2-7A]|nr:hypothetical protein [Streptomyces sp. ST2-7A]